MTKQLSLIAAVFVCAFLALETWSAQQEIALYEETQRRLFAESRPATNPQSIDQMETNVRGDY